VFCRIRGSMPGLSESERSESSGVDAGEDALDADVIVHGPKVDTGQHWHMDYHGHGFRLCVRR